MTSTKFSSMSSRNGRVARLFRDGGPDDRGNPRGAIPADASSRPPRLKTWATLPWTTLPALSPRAAMLVVGLAVALGAAQVQAAVWNTGAGTFTTAQINTNIANGDTVNVDGNTTFNIDGVTDTDLIAVLVVANAVTLTVNFSSTGDLRFGNATDNGNASLTVNGTMNVAGTGGGKFDFSPTTTGNILTVIGTVAGTDTGNGFVVGNNTLKTMASTTSLNDVTLSGTVAKLDIDAATSIDTLTVTTAGQNVGLDIAEGLTLTIDDQFSIPAGSAVDLIGANGGAAETLTVTGGIVLNGNAAELVITGDTGNSTVINAALTVNVDGGIIDMANGATLTSIGMNAGLGNLTIETGGAALTTTVDVNDNILTLSEAGTVTTVGLDTAGGTLDVDASGTFTTLTFTSNSTIDLDTDAINFTITNPVSLGAFKMSILGSGAGGAETIAATVNMTSASAEIEVTGVDADNIDGLTINVQADGATLDTDIDTNFTAVNMTAGAGDLTLELAANVFTGPINVNNNTLTVTEGTTGTLSNIDLDDGGGVLDLNVTDITSLTVDVEATVGGGETVTMNLGGVTPTAGTVTMSGAGTLTIAEAGSVFNVALQAGTFDVDAATTVVNLFDLDTGAAAIDVANGVTLTATNGVDTQTNTLTLSGTGTINQVDADGTAAGVTFSAAGTVTALNVTGANTVITGNANGTITTLTMGASMGITLGDSVNLTITNDFNVGANTLTLTGSGGTSQDTLTTSGANGIVLDNNAGNLTIAATNAADNITGFKVTVNQAITPDMDINETCAPSAINQTDGAGASTLTLSVAAGKTVTTTVDVNDNVLLLDSTGTVGTVQMDTAGGEVDVNESCTITTFTPTANCTLDVVGTKNLTITNAVTVPTGVILTFDSANAANTETLTLTNGLTLNGNSAELALTTDVAGTMAIAGLITSASNTTPTILDLNVKNVTLTDLEVDDSINIECDSSAGTCTLTIANAVNVDAGGVLKFTGTNDANADTLAFTTGLTLNGAAAELEVSGDATTAMVVNGAITNAVSAGVIDVNNNTTFGGTVDLSANMTLDVANTMTMTIANGVDTNTSTLTLNNTGTVSKVDIDGSAGAVNTTATGGTITTLTVTSNGTLDIDDTFTITNDVDLAANLTVDVLTGKVLTVGATDGIDTIGANTLTLTGDGTVSEVTLNAAGGQTLQINDGDVTVTTLNVNGAGTLNVATGQTWSHTYAAGSLDLTLGGGGTLATLTITVPNAGTRTITAAAAGNLTVSTFMSTWTGGGGANVLEFAGTGDLTIANQIVPDTVDDVKKSGSGTLTLTGGIDFVTNNDVDLDIDGGTVILGSAGSVVDIIFGHDNDSIDVANTAGATLTTFGAISGFAGANTNVQIGAAGTLNLSASAGKNLTATADNDLNLGGTVNINGTNSDYTLLGAFIYQFGSVNINTTGSLIYTVNQGKIDFQPGSTVALAGNATLTLGSNTNGQEVILDTVGNTGTFTIDRNNSSNLTMNHVDLSRCTYASATGKTAQCDSIIHTNVDFTTSNTNWIGACPSSGSSTTPPPTPPQFTTDTSEGTTDSSGETTTTVETASGTSAQVQVSGADVGATVSVTLEDGNSKGTALGMAGGDAGEGNAIPRTLTVTSTAAAGTFSAVVEIVLTDSDLATAGLTDQQIGLYVFNDTLETWELAGTNNVGNAVPTDVVGDYGVHAEAGGTTRVWTVLDHFSVFAPGEVTTFTLQTSVDPESAGTVTVQPLQDVYSDGMEVTATASAVSGFTFSGWSGDAGATESSLAVTMDSDKSITALFVEEEATDVGGDDEELELFALVVLTDLPEGGSIVISPLQDDYSAGTEVTLTASANEGFTFLGWFGDVNSTDNPLTVTMHSDLAITAEFTEDLSLTIDEPSKIDCGGGGGMCGALGMLCLPMALITMMGLRRRTWRR
ncbi:MAG: hypothetical protein V3W34_12510 [Phycisphaerae bacterium]